MDKATLARITEILEADPDFYVPVKKLWVMLQRDGLALDLDLEDFHSRLEADDHFEFMEGVNHTEGLEDPELAAQIELDMEAMGLFSGPRVKLASREMTAEDVITGLSRSLGQLKEALQGAWETRPEEDAETAGMLLDALAVAEELEREVQEIIKEQSERDEEET
ncbi:MAG: hypothetical protein PVH62_00110 [Anaerolineae bacterium]|jgi:hypothetical protein